MIYIDELGLHHRVIVEYRVGGNDMENMGSGNIKTGMFCFLVIL